MKVSFYGGARDVTGACYLFESAQARVLIDCGLFQGSHTSAETNAAPFPFSADSIDAVIVTHAHLDHIGRLPKLCAEGFRGTIFSTPAARDLARLLLEDALHLGEREGTAFYDRKDLERTLAVWQTVPYDTRHIVGDIAFELKNAGHILGSSMIRMEAEGKIIFHTGDLGNDPSVLLPPPDHFSDINYLFIESTYGNMAHEALKDRGLLLERAVEDTIARGGTLMIPAFAAERTQDILFLLNEMLVTRRVPDVPVFVDSPLAIRITEVYEQYPDAFRPEIRDLLGKHRQLFRSKKLRFTPTAEESKAINDVPGPKIIVAGSGMMQGGRILHHLRRYLPDQKSILLIVGFQATGSVGRRLIEGADRVTIHGENIAVRAEIRKINGFSAHADFPQLFAFAASSRDTLKHVFTIQGEDLQAEHLAQQIRDRLGVPATAPLPGEHAVL